MKIKIIKNIVLFILVFVFSIILSHWFGQMYYSSLNITQGISSFIVSESVNYYITGFILALFLFVFLFFTAFGDSTKYWWIGILLIPAIIFELYFDLEHIYIPIVIGLIGWVIGFVISKIIGNIKPIKSGQNQKNV